MKGSARAWHWLSCVGCEDLQKTCLVSSKRTAWWWPPARHWLSAAAAWLLADRSGDMKDKNGSCKKETESQLISLCPCRAIRHCLGCDNWKKRVVVRYVHEFSDSVWSSAVVILTVHRQTLPLGPIFLWARGAYSNTVALSLGTPTSRYALCAPGSIWAWT